MEDISFVVQGPIVGNEENKEGVYSTAEVLTSIRKQYPLAEIVLSTWKGSATDGLEYDQLVLNDDPGGFMHFGALVNSNRMILSTKAGIQKATRKFVVKTRSDILFTGNTLINLLASITPTKGKYALFKSFVLSSIFYVRNPMRLNLVFHPSDIFLMGTKADLLFYFDVPLAPREFYINADEGTRIVPEQYFLLQGILNRKGKDYYVPRWGYTNFSFFKASEKYLFNNFKFYDVADLGIEFPKRLYSVFKPEGNYTLAETSRLANWYQGTSLKNTLLIHARGMHYLYIHAVLPRVTSLYQKTIGRLFE